VLIFCNGINQPFSLALSDHLSRDQTYLYTLLGKNSDADWRFSAVPFLSTPQSYCHGIISK